ncbi:MAG TPA: hypothetical protein VKU36_01710 [Candidatus Babeliales bacterium]|nr:hypothetical protein [Candidatus Babeliales bacterium]
MVSSKISRSLFIFSLAATFALKPMELTNEEHNHHAIPNLSSTVCNLKLACRSVIYGDSNIHTDLRDNNRIESSLKDPLLYVKITALQKNKKNVFGGTYMYLPAKLLKGLNDESLLSIHFKNGSDLTFEDEPLQVFAKCRKCEKKKKLNGSSFAEQFNAMMNDFYTQPCVSIFCNKEELKNALVVSERRIDNTTTTDAHGPNGISSKQAFEKLVAEYELNKNRAQALSSLALEGI